METTVTLESLDARLQHLEAIHDSLRSLVRLLAGINEQPVTPIEPALLSTADAARYLGVGVSTLHRRVAVGVLGSPIKDGSRSRYLRSDLDRYLDGLPVKWRESNGRGRKR